MPRLFLFGAPRLEQNGQIVPLRRSKALALLAYLALSRQPQDRNGLLALLWPEFDAASARNNLRRELSLLKATLGEEILAADRMQVSSNAQAALWIDVVASPTTSISSGTSRRRAGSSRPAEDTWARRCGSHPRRGCIPG